MFRSTIEVLTYPTVMDRGRPVPDYTVDPSAVPIKGVDIQPGASAELVAQRREGVSVAWSVYIPAKALPTGVEVTEGSIVRVPGGQVCQVDGRPMAWVEGSPLDHYLVALVAWAVPQ